MIERDASGGSNAAAEQANFTKVIAARKIRENEFATGIVFRNFHETNSNEIEAVRRSALLDDGLTGSEALELDAFFEMRDEFG